MRVDRRSFLKSSFLLSLSNLSISTSAFAEGPLQSISRSPIDTLEDFSGPTIFTGDHEMAAHDIFWDKERFLRKLGGIPEISADYDVVIIGGGISGLLSAWFHRDQKTLLLEGHPQMGGNCKATRVDEATMSLGAAYINVPEVGDHIDEFLKELGIRDCFRVEQDSDATAAMNGKILPHFWDKYPEIKAKFIDIYDNNYPTLPDYPEGPSPSMLEWDTLSFTDWLKQNFDTIPEEVSEFFHQYCWSSFGGSPSELSAAHVIGFISSDFKGVMALPGGNAVIAEALYKRLADRITMINDAFAVNVKGTKITYYLNGELKSVRAKKVIMACSKQVSKHVIESLPADQFEAIQGIKYRAYLVANVLFKKDIASPGYDLFALRGGVKHSEKTEMEERGFCDIVFADWANGDQAKNILTLYIPMPFDAGNQSLFNPNAYQKHSDRIRKNLALWYDTLGITDSDIASIRMTRFGHALPLAKVGMISSGRVKLAQRPIDQSIYFVHTDNWVSPCFESAFYCARAALA